jgi:CheY-like chemotaxis protein
VALILVVDDDPGVRAVISRVLLKAGHQVVLAADGASGLATYHELAPDLALVGQFMPEMDGCRLMRQFTALAPTMPVLLMVSVPSAAREERGPVSDMIVKPFGADALVAAVTVALSRISPPDRGQGYAS